MKSKYLLPALLMSAGTLTALAQEPADTVPEPEVSINLDDFVVTAQKEVIKSDGAKLTYDVSEDESTKGQTLLDALKKVPMVTSTHRTIYRSTEIPASRSMSTARKT